MLKRILFVVVLIVQSIIARPQTNNSSILPVVDYSGEPREYVIGGVTVTGVYYTDKNALISMSGLAVGRKVTVPGDEITKVVEKFWRQGLFSDAKVVATEIRGDSIWLELQLKEHARLSQFEIKGAKKGDVTDLQEKIGLKPGNQVNDNVKNNIRTIINKFYKEKGYWNIKIDLIEKKDTGTANRVVLTADIHKNKKVKIASITFNGNEDFTDKRLRRVLKKTKQRSLNIFKSSKFVEAKYKEDKEKLNEFFAKNGYRDYEFLKDSIKVISPDRIALNIDIREGNQYYVRSIRWIGNTKYSDDMLNRRLIMKPGDVYDLVALEKRLSQDEDAVSSLYMDNGYLFSSIDPVEAAIENDSVDLEMHVTEGRRFTIKNILISGNTKTNEHVVRRELETYPGQLFSKSDIINSVRRLGQLGYFNPENIEPIPLPNQSDGTVDIKYNLEEKANDQLELSGGWGGNMLVGTLGLRFNNFSARNLFNGKAWRPVPSGDGQSLSIRAQTNGSYYKSYSLGFTEPWFGGKKPNSFSFSLIYQVQNGATNFLQTSDKSFKVIGASIGLGRRLRWPDRQFQLYNEIAFQNYSLNNWSGYFTFSDGSSKNLSFKIALSRNSTDQPIYPRTGSTFTLALQVTPPYSLFKKDKFWELSNDEVAGLRSKLAGATWDGRTEAGRQGMLDSAVYQTAQSRKYKWIEYHKWTYKGTLYYSLVKDLVLSVNTQFGYLGYFKKNLGYSPFEGFSLGGDGYSGYSPYGKETIGLRGYQNESLTPIVPTTFYYGPQASSLGISTANIYSKVSLELRHPITMQSSAQIFALIFIEGGNSWYNYEKFNPFAIKRSAGVGIRASLPMFGLLGIDWGYGFDRIPGNDAANKGNFHFVMGQQF